MYIDHEVRGMMLVSKVFYS